MPVVAAVGGFLGSAAGSAIVGGGLAAAGSIAAANSAKDVAKTQAGAVKASSDANTALAREERDKNERLFAGYLQDEAMARAYADALQFGQGSYTPPGSNSGQPVTITRDQVVSQIQGTPLAQLANTDFAAREGITQDTYAGAQTLADQEAGALWGVGESNYSSANDLAGEARTGRRGVAQSNLDQRLTNNAAVYDAWDAQAQDQADRAVDETFSRGGVTGLVGQTRAGVADVRQNYALEGARQRTELNAAAYDPFYSDINYAENTYWSDRGGALDERGAARTATVANRGQRRQNAYDTYSRSRGANYDSFAGDRLTAYGAYEDALRDRTARGAGARENIAGFNSSYAATAANQNSRAGDAAAAAYGRQGQIQQQLYGDLAEIAGGAYETIKNRKKG